MRTDRGLVVSQDSGGSWKLRCAEGAGYGVGTRPAMAWADDELLLATPSGLFRDAAGCDRRPAWPALEGVAVSALVADGAGGLWAATSQAEIENHLWASEDAGDTWDRRGAPLVDQFLSGLAVADGGRLYAAGVGLDEAGAVEHFVRRTDDQGATWVGSALPLSDEEHRLELLGTPPGSRDVVLAAAVAYASADTPDRLLRSTDGGESFKEVARIRGISGIAASPHPGALHISSAQGLFHSEDAGKSWSPLPNMDRPLGCARSTPDGGVLLCGEHLLDHFALARLSPPSVDPEVLLSWGGVSAEVECGDAVCDAAWVDWQAELPADPQAPITAAPSSDSGCSVGGAETLWAPLRR